MPSDEMDNALEDAACALCHGGFTSHEMRAEKPKKYWAKVSPRAKYMYRIEAAAAVAAWLRAFPKGYLNGVWIGADTAEAIALAVEAQSKERPDA